MHSAIVVVVMPEDREARLAFQGTVNLRLEKPLNEQQGVRSLADNVWLVNFQENPAAFARLVDAVVQHKRPCEILQLDDAPRWLPAGFDPSTAAGRSGG